MPDRIDNWGKKVLMPYSEWLEVSIAQSQELLDLALRRRKKAKTHFDVSHETTVVIKMGASLDALQMCQENWRGRRNI